MATVYVSGTVDRIFFDGRGVSVLEIVKVKNEPKKVFWTCWFDEAPRIEVGQPVKVTGLFSDKIEEFEKDGETRRKVVRSLNKANIELVTPPTRSPEPVRVTDWAAQTAPAFEDTPF